MAYDTQKEVQQIRSFMDLHAWQKAHQTVWLLYKATETFPKSEMFGLTSQMRRAAVSAESNIAEGFGRTTAKDKGQFYAIAKSSMYELQSQTRTAFDLGYLQNTERETLELHIPEAIRRCTGLQKSATTYNPQ